MPTTLSKNRAKTCRPSTELQPSIVAERHAILNALQSVVELVGGVVGSNVEVVLHDLSQPARSIIAIANGHVSKRGIGYPILSGPKVDLGFHAAVETLTERGVPGHSITANYTTLTEGGQPLRSGTVTFRDSQGAPFAALCLNADLTVVDMAYAWMERMLNGQCEAPLVPDAPPEMDLLAREIINEAIALARKPLSLMNKEEKVHAVNTMMERGLFLVKGGVEKAASALGVTRFTIYNYLDELRQRSNGAQSPPAKKQKSQRLLGRQSTASRRGP